MTASNKALLRLVVITLFPQMVHQVAEHGVVGRAIQQGLVELSLLDLRQYTEDKTGRVDDRPYGGGPGMVMQVQPLASAVIAARGILGKQARVIYLSPQGRQFTQSSVKTLCEQQSLIMIAGRYEGIDERFIETYVDEEWSIGDFVLSGGELPAMVMIDAMARTLPGALGDDESAQQDSFMNGLLDCPHYTRPESIEGNSVPEVLMSGNHQVIKDWRLQQSLGRTWLRRPELLNNLTLDEHQQTLLDDFIRQHKSLNE